MLDWLSGSFRITRHVRPKLSCRSCEAIAQALAPSLPIRRGRAPDPGCSRGCWWPGMPIILPLYRQSGIYPGEVVELSGYGLLLQALKRGPPSRRQLPISSRDEPPSRRPPTAAASSALNTSRFPRRSSRQRRRTIDNNRSRRHQRTYAFARPDRRIANVLRCAAPGEGTDHGDASGCPCGRARVCAC